MPSRVLTVYLFLSTPSARRATILLGSSGLFRLISIHALREEGDSWRCTMPMCFDLFLSTPSARRATAEFGDDYTTYTISIHALREEGDSVKSADAVQVQVFLSTPSARRATRRVVPLFGLTLYFYPRPPRGGRLLVPYIPAFHNDFYPRPPRGGRRSYLLVP